MLNFLKTLTIWAVIVKICLEMYLENEENHVVYMWISRIQTQHLNIDEQFGIVGIAL